MAKNVDDFLDDEQVQEMLTDMLRRLDAVIGDTQLMLGDDIPVELWRIFQYGALDRVIHSAGIQEDEVEARINNLLSNVKQKQPKKSVNKNIKLVFLKSNHTAKTKSKTPPLQELNQQSR